MLLKSRLFFLFIISFPFIFSCSENDSSTNTPLTPDEVTGSWVSDIQCTFYIQEDEFTYSHDNRIYETENFLIFSDASIDEVKIRMANYAESAMSSLKEGFGISTSAELGIVDQSTKLKLFANKNHSNYTQRIFENGMIIYSFDSPMLDNIDPEIRARITRVIKHELMHIFQHLFGLGLNSWDDWPEVWFSEGIAEYVCGSVSPPLTSISEVDEWLAGAYHINPILIKNASDYPGPFQTNAEYYPMFETAVRYLLDENGLGKNLLDVKALYEALKNGDSFENAFEQTMGIQLSYYQQNFYDLVINIF